MLYPHLLWMNNFSTYLPDRCMDMILIIVQYFHFVFILLYRNLMEFLFALTNDVKASTAQCCTLMNYTSRYFMSVRFDS
jgi:hypothetical protein